MSTLDALISAIYDGRDATLIPEFEGWARDSRRFRAFATDYRSKLRAKLRNAPRDGGIYNLRAELETAALVLCEKRFMLEYEKYATLKQRGPDFTVTFKTHTPFNIEVRRIRSVEMEDIDPEARTGKLMAVLCNKVGQMLPGIVNLLWLTAEREISESDVTGAAAALRGLAERKTESYFQQRGFKGAADFLKQFQRLSGIVVRQPDEIVLWLNPLARHKAPPELVTAIRRLGTCVN